MGPGLPPERTAGVVRVFLCFRGGFCHEGQLDFPVVFLQLSAVAICQPVVHQFAAAAFAGVVGAGRQAGARGAGGDRRAGAAVQTLAGSQAGGGREDRGPDLPRTRPRARLARPVSGPGEFGPGRRHFARPGHHPFDRLEPVAGRRTVKKPHPVVRARGRPVGGAAQSEHLLQPQHHRF